MWQKILETIKLVFHFGEELQRNRADIEALQEEMRTLTAAMQRVVFELQRQSENEAHEREKLALRFEIQQLRSAHPPTQEKSTQE